MKTQKIIPEAFGDALSLAGKSAGGLHSLGAVVPVTHTTEAIVRAIMVAALAANDEYQTSKASRLVATRTQAASDQKARALILAARDVLKPLLGSRYSQAWNQVGFLTPSLGVPSTVTKRLALVKLLQLYFTAHPEREVPHLGVTAANAGARHQELDTNINALATAKVTQRQKKAARDGAFATLRAELRKLYRELKVELAPNDPRWREFGFKVPADVHVTEAPKDLKLAQDAAGQLQAGWGHTVNADRFRVYQRLVGTDAEPVLVGTTTNTSFGLGTFAPGTHLEVQVTAINAAGEGRRSEAVRFICRMPD